MGVVEKGNTGKYPRGGRLMQEPRRWPGIVTSGRLKGAVGGVPCGRSLVYQGVPGIVLCRVMSCRGGAQDVASLRRGFG